LTPASAVAAAVNDRKTFGSHSLDFRARGKYDDARELMIILYQNGHHNVADLVEAVRATVRALVLPPAALEHLPHRVGGSLLALLDAGGRTVRPHDVGTVRLERIEPSARVVAS